jgi:hypothetical protein
VLALKYHLLKKDSLWWDQRDQGSEVRNQVLRFYVLPPAPQVWYLCRPDG